MKITLASDLHYAFHGPGSHAEVLVAVEQMREANTSRFALSTPLTPAQQAAADKLRQSLGSLMVTYRGASTAEVVDAGVKVLLAGLKRA
jgi:hypothetical protein